MNDEHFLKQAYDRAMKIDPHAVAPNPRVGCVVVQEGAVIAQGVHEYFGGPHAEINALDQLKNLRTQELKNSLVSKSSSSQVLTDCTVYITLEPCDCFHGKKTGSCVDRLIEARPKKVVIGALDPKFAGKSVEKLKTAGIEAIYNNQYSIFNTELNPFFEHYQKHQKPFITLKAGQSLDGRITAQTQYITNKKSLVQVHKMRAQYSAMLTTTETLLQDNARMDCRLESGERLRHYVSQPMPWSVSDPKLIILGKREVPKDCKIWQINSPREVVQFETLADFLSSDLYPRLDSIMTECGQIMMNQLLEQDLVDRLHLFIAPKILGTGKNVVMDEFLLKDFHLKSVQSLGGDLECIYER